MSERTAQCHECAEVFECGPTGRLPKLCPKCKSGGGGGSEAEGSQEQACSCDV